MSRISTAEAAAPALIKTPSRTRHPHIVPGQTPTPYTDLFFVSFATLFLELACIRWFGSAVLYLTFFTNLVLFACFLGMSVGLLAAGRRADLANWIIPLAVAAVGLAELTSWAYVHMALGPRSARSAWQRAGWDRCRPTRILRGGDLFGWASGQPPSGRRPRL